MIPVILALSLFPCDQGLRAQTLTLYYDGVKSIQDCRIISISEFNVGVEHTPFLPGIHARTNISLAEITGVREYSRANRYAPYLAFLGGYIGVRSYFHERGPIEEMSLSERFATWLDTPVNFIGAVCIGGAVGYFGGHFLLGGNRELIVLENLSNAEKLIILTGYIESSRDLSEPIKHTFKEP